MSGQEYGRNSRSWLVADLRARSSCSFGVPRSLESPEARQLKYSHWPISSSQQERGMRTISNDKEQLTCHMD
jgi:hypothetical protein